MLKWAVNGPRQSYLPTVGESEVLQQKRIISRRSLNSLADSIPNATANAERRRLRRKSSDIPVLRQKLARTGDKENQLTSTPLPISMRGSPASLRRLGSLKDLSNITPDDFCTSPLRLHTPKRKAVALKCTPELQQNSATIRTPSNSNIPPQYASTLPTFDVEYSPCGLIPGPILALRGIGIADTYFEKPRYLTQEFQELNRREEKSILPTTAEPFHEPYDEDSTLSSSKMGDMTLERMIDAILESARKERKLPKCSSKQTTISKPTVMSPTYTPAEDPASDLHEFWDATSEKYHQEQEGILKSATTACDFNEREVRSPLMTRSKQQQQQTQHPDAFHLRRQRAVRRKRRMSIITNKVKNSAQKIFGVATEVTTTQAKRLKLSVDDPLPEKKVTVRNISPDSGRNSCSDYEDSIVEVVGATSAANVNKTNDALDATKRRLSFSLKETDECQKSTS